MSADLLQKPYRPYGGHLRYWRRQRLDHHGEPWFSSPIYVQDVESGVTAWYTEDGEWSSSSGISVSQLLRQGGVSLPYPPWLDPAQRLPEGF